jgi:drug/metabolite transporter (DMT)-like permease
MTAKTTTAAVPVRPANPERWKIALAMLTIYFVWGSTYLGIRIAVETIPPFMMTATRFILAGGFLYIWLRYRQVPNPPWVEWRNALLIGALMLAGGGGLVAFSQQWVASGLAAVAVAAVPLWAALFAGFWGRWPTRAEWAGLGIGLVGVALLNLDKGMHANPLGAIALLIGPLAWALGSIWSQHVRLPKGLMGSAIEMLGGGLTLIVFSLIAGENLAAMPSVRSLVAFTYLTLIGSLLAFSAYMYVLSKVRPAMATSYAYVNPVLAVILGAMLVGETITLPGLIGMVIIISGVVLLAFGRDQRTN